MPPHFYASHEVFRLEAERIFHRQWFAAGRTEQLPSRGDVLVVEVAGESVIVIRGRDDALAAFYNVCRHRGSQLVREPPLPDAARPAARNSGRAGGAIVCPYHAWSYNLDGSAARRAIRAVRCGLPEGEVLARAGRARDLGRIHLPQSLRRTPPPPFADQLVKAKRMLGRYPFADMRRGAQIVYDVAANWKVLMENYNECYHCGPAHPELCALVPAFREQGGAGLAWEDGIPHRPGAWTFTASGDFDARAIPGALGFRANASQRRDRVSEPAAVGGGRAYRGLHAVAHGAADHTRIACEFLFHESEIGKSGFDPSDVVEFWDVVNRQDWRICEGVQTGMRSRGFRGAFFAPMEDPSMDIRRYLESHLGDLSAIR